MSEFQYYEFLAIDRPLTSEEMSEVRDLSTRAHITPVSFSNVYNWGDFKGDPDKLMKRYFDAHVYVANWMTAVFKVRVPIEVLPQEIVEDVAAPYSLTIDKTKTHWIITWSLEEGQDEDRFDFEEGSGWMARLTPVRDELIRGDLRSLYIGWLAAVSEEFLDEEDVEPISAEGMGSLTTAQKALAEFLEVDQDLLAGAAIGSPDMEQKGVEPKEMDQWIDNLPRSEVKKILQKLLTGKGQQAEREFKNRFSAWQRDLQDDKVEAPLRMVEELLKNAKAAKEQRLEREKRQQKKREIERRKKREAHLKALMNNLSQAWKSVDQTLQRGSGAAYDDACRSLIDLSEAYALTGKKKAFQQKMDKFMTSHIRRKAFIQRLVKAAIWQKK